MELHNDDIPGDQTPMRRAIFTRSLITGSVAVVLGLVLIIVGLVHRDNVVVPVLAVIGGALVLGYDFTSARVGSGTWRVRTLDRRRRCRFPLKSGRRSSTEAVSAADRLPDCIGASPGPYPFSSVRLGGLLLMGVVAAPLSCLCMR